MQVMLADLIAYFVIVLSCYARMLTSGKALIWWSNMGEHFGIFILIANRIVHKSIQSKSVSKL